MEKKKWQPSEEQTLYYVLSNNATSPLTERFQQAQAQLPHRSIRALELRAAKLLRESHEEWTGLFTRCERENLDASYASVLESKPKTLPSSTVIHKDDLSELRQEIQDIKRLLKKMMKKI